MIVLTNRTGEPFCLRFLFIMIEEQQG